MLAQRLRRWPNIEPTFLPVLSDPGSDSVISSTCLVCGQGSYDLHGVIYMEVITVHCVNYKGSQGTA